MKLNGFEHRGVNRCLMVGYMKKLIVIVRNVKVKIGPTGRIIIDDTDQCSDCFIMGS